MRTKAQSYVDLTRDAGFKTVLGSKTNKDLLIGILNYILPPENMVEDIIEYMDREQTPPTVISKISYFDLTCKGKDGSLFIIEMQNHREKDFFQRCVYYGAETYSRELTPSMEYTDLRPVYVVAFLNFSYPHADESLWDSDNFIAQYIFKENRTNEIVPSTISVIFVNLKRFTKTSDECRTEKDWLFYLFRSINLFDDLRNELEVKKFPLVEKMEHACKFAAMDSEQYSKYANIMRCERDYFSSLSNAKAEAREEGLAEGREKGLLIGLAEGREEGRAEGREKGREEGREIGITEGIEKGKAELTEALVRKMLTEGLPIEQISRLLALSSEQIELITQP